MCQCSTSHRDAEDATRGKPSLSIKGPLSPGLPGIFSRVWCRRWGKQVAKTTGLEPDTNCKSDLAEMHGWKTPRDVGKEQQKETEGDDC
eukprot:193509-Rhodomonas_salina.2